VLGPASRIEAERGRDRGRRGQSPHRKLYDLAAWKRLRVAVLERDLWTCQGCPAPHLLTDRPNRPTSAVVDHMRPHRGDLALFLDPANCQAVCKEWHDGEKQRRERRPAAG